MAFSNVRDKDVEHSGDLQIIRSSHERVRVAGGMMVAREAQSNRNRSELRNPWCRRCEYPFMYFDLATLGWICEACGEGNPRVSRPVIIAMYTYDAAAPGNPLNNPAPNTIPVFSNMTSNMTNEFTAFTTFSNSLAINTQVTIQEDILNELEQIPTPPPRST